MFKIKNILQSEIKFSDFIKSKFVIINVFDNNKNYICKNIFKKSSILIRKFLILEISNYNFNNITIRLITNYSDFSEISIYLRKKNS